MAINVVGTLPDPMGNPVAKGTIRVTTVDSAVSVIGSEGTHQTTKTGAYDFPLEEGVYFIELNQNDEYTEEVYVEVTDTMTGSITLPQLLRDHKWTNTQ